MVLANESHVVWPGRTARHAALNDLIWRALVRAGFGPSKEPVGLTRSDGKSSPDAWRDFVTLVGGQDSRLRRDWHGFF